MSLKKEYTKEQLEALAKIKTLNLVQCLTLLKECAVIQGNEYKEKLKAVSSLKDTVPK